MCGSPSSAALLTCRACKAPSSCRKLHPGLNRFRPPAGLWTHTCCLVALQMLSLNELAASSDPLMRSLDSCVTRQEVARRSQETARSHEPQAAAPQPREGAWSGSRGDSSRSPSSTGAVNLAATYPPGPAAGGAAAGGPPRRSSPAKQATASRLRVAAPVGYQAMHQAHVEAVQQQVRHGGQGCLC